MKLALTVLVAMLCLLVPCGVLAAEAEPAGEPAPSAEDVLLAAGKLVLEWIAANPFYAGIVFLALAAVVGAILSRGAHDRCLADFEGYPVTLELKDGTVYHGELDAEKTGLEFLYEKTTPQEGVTKTSFLIYSAEYGGICALVRYPDRLDAKQLKARERAARKAYHPNVFRRTRRSIRNFFASTKDSIYEAFGMAMGEVKKSQAAAPAVQTGGKYIDRVGKQAVDVATNLSYDPLLEKQIGLRVVLTLLQGTEGQVELVGTFREYTKDFFVLMDTDYESGWEIALPPSGTGAFVRGIAARPARQHRRRGVGERRVRGQPARQRAVWRVPRARHIARGGGRDPSVQHHARGRPDRAASGRVHPPQERVGRAEEARRRPPGGRRPAARHRQGRVGPQARSAVRDPRPSEKDPGVREAARLRQRLHLRRLPRARPG